MIRAKALVEFAGDADGQAILAFRPEYELFTELFRAMFADLRPGARVAEERFESDIPGVVFVRQTMSGARPPPPPTSARWDVDTTTIGQQRDT